ncbi:MAG: hypothetical protein NTW19_17530 [Planctomycetota bacterium]|nr:hypothetical protein [Planctomycetota bacterium]
MLVRLRRSIPRLAPAVLLLGLAPFAYAEHLLIAKSPANDKWHAPEGAREAVYIGDPAPETPIVLRKSALTGGAVLLTISSDAEKCVLRSGSIEVPIDLVKERPNRLRLDGDLLRPRIELNDRDLPAQRGQWVRLLLQTGEANLSLVFVNAKFVNLEYDADRGPLAKPIAVIGGPDGATTVAVAAAAPVVAQAGATAVPAPAPGVPVMRVTSPVQSVQSVGPNTNPDAIPPRTVNAPVAVPLPVVANPTAQPQPASAAPTAPTTGQPAAAGAPAAAAAAPGSPTPAIPVVTQQATNTPGAPITRYATPSANALPPETDENNWRLTLKAGIDVTNEYLYRGIGIENQDIIMHPWTTVGVRLYNDQDSEWINSLSAVVTLWNSNQWGPSGYDFRKSPTPTHTTRQKFYEQQFLGGIDVQMFKRWNLYLGHQTRMSINGNFFDVHMIDAKVTYNDKSPDYNWQLWPYLLVSAEYEGQSDAGNGQSDSHTSLYGKGMYAEVGVRPVFSLYKFDVNSEIKMAVPAAMGFSISDYYEDVTGHDHKFGFFSVGPEFSIPLIRRQADPGRQFSLDFTLGGKMLILGDGARKIGQERGTGNDTVHFLGTAGLVFEY